MRNRRSLFFLLLSIVSGLAAVIVYRATLTEAPAVSAGPATIETTPVVMAAEPLSAGIAVRESQLTVAQWPSDFVPEGGMQAAAEVADRIPRRRIEAGEPVLSPMLLEPGRGAGLPGLIEPNHRAMSVKADAVVGVGGFIQPGSRVDVLAQLRAHDPERGFTPYARTILQNVRVLAIDQNFDRQEGSAPMLASVVTLEVDPVEAQLLAYASAEGTLQLALRSQVDESLVSLKSTGPRDFLDEVVKPKAKPKPKRKATKPRNTIESIRGTDVSRDYL
jgi:pilus assembly protein CpaB